jgi:S1-C subfamily serine protease
MGSSRRRVRRLSRVLGAAALISTTSLGLLPNTAGLAVGTAPNIELTRGGHGWPGGWSDQLQPSGTGSATVDSNPATKAEQTGVAVIDTELAYQGAAGAGTGIVLTSGGEVLTNYHVVDGATSIKVTIAATGSTYPAKVVGHSATADVALLQLKGAGGLTTAKINGDTVATGTRVTAVGNAGGTGALTAADGRVVSLSSTITTASEGSLSSETLRGLIETDADVVAGDSGGPLLDSEGEVIGIDTAASSGQEIDGYAIPIAKAEAVVDQIRSGHETSTVQIGASAFLGVEISNAGTTNQPGAYFGNSGWPASSADAGVTVGGVLDGSAAASAGLGVGDTLTAIGSTPITDADSLTSVLASHHPGDRVQISWTDSAEESHRATVTLGSSPEA